MGGEVKVSLRSGRQVVLAEWDEYKPPVHGDGLQNKRWNALSARDGMAFYDSTVHYMRNDWAQKHMPGAHVSLGRENLLLFYSAGTKTWHSADALDVDHVKPWKAHLTGLGVDNYADAHRAYNDVGNLRLLPSVYNRARDSADRILLHGADSSQWKAWTNERCGFDPSVDPPKFDPERDIARRTGATLGQAWSPEDGRKGLAFDAGVRGKWFEQQLKESYVGTVVATSPIDGSKHNVPLFRCAATQQLVTRDALDIDHRIPFETVAKEMAKHAGPGGLSKADALDAYNDTSNLRLVGRGANSSHEWELNVSGEYRDEEVPEIHGEFDGFMVGKNTGASGVSSLIREHFDTTPKASSSSAMDMREDGPVHQPGVRRKGNSPGLPAPQASVPSNGFGGGSQSSSASPMDQSDSLAASVLTQKSGGSAFAHAQLPGLGGSTPSAHGPSAPSPSALGHPGLASQGFGGTGLGSSSLGSMGFGASPSGSPSPPPSGFGAPISAFATPSLPVAKAPLINESASPHNAVFRDTVAKLGDLVAKSGGGLSSQQQHNAAGALMCAARDNQLPGIDYIARSDNGAKLFAVSGSPHSPFQRWAEVPTQQAIAQSIEQSSEALSKPTAVASLSSHGPMQNSGMTK
ncbi:XVIPCD domain-containing protein [Lysobacter sp. Hz 25]|uniref:XVIPCD domain-containing protein n=1 Tax=Lysobacter sp. Hz 25 TaxID=3383698 RepID=UPI0038D44073